MPRLCDPSGTVAIILGAHDWTLAGLDKTLSFRRSAAYWRSYLLTPSPLGLGLEPELLLDLFDDPSSANDQLVRMKEWINTLAREKRETASPIRDVLIYYVGHGTCEQGRHLSLLVRGTREGMEEQSSINTVSLAHVLRVAAPLQRRLLILDCCFSEAAVDAFGAMSSLDEAVAATAARDLAVSNPTPEKGTLLFCSSPRKRVSIGPKNADRTLFTGALLKVLKRGVRSDHEMLTFEDLRDATYDQMIADYSSLVPRPALHEPDQEEGDLRKLGAFPNVYYIMKAKAEIEGFEPKQVESHRGDLESGKLARPEPLTIDVNNSSTEEKRVIDGTEQARLDHQPLENRVATLAAAKVTTTTVFGVGGDWPLVRTLVAPVSVDAGGWGFAFIALIAVAQKIRNDDPDMVIASVIFFVIGCLGGAIAWQQDASAGWKPAIIFGLSWAVTQRFAVFLGSHLYLEFISRNFLVIGLEGAGSAVLISFVLRRLGERLKWQHVLGLAAGWFVVLAAFWSIAVYLARLRYNDLIAGMSGESAPFYKHFGSFVLVGLNLGKEGLVIVLILAVFTYALMGGLLFLCLNQVRRYSQR